MPEVVRGDVEIVREVLKRDGVALQHASEDLKVGPSSPADGVTFKRVETLGVITVTSANGRNG